MLSKYFSSAVLREKLHTIIRLQDSDEKLLQKLTRLSKSSYLCQTFINQWFRSLESKTFTEQNEVLSKLSMSILSNFKKTEGDPGRN